MARNRRIQAGSNILSFEIHKIIITLFGIRKIFHSSGRNLLLYLFIKRVIKLTVVIIQEHYCYQPHTKFYPLFLSQGYLNMHMKLLKIVCVDFDEIDQPLIKYSVFVRLRRKSGSIMGQYVSYL